MLFIALFQPQFLPHFRRNKGWGLTVLISPKVPVYAIRRYNFSHLPHLGCKVRFIAQVSAYGGG